MHLSSPTAWLYDLVYEPLGTGEGPTLPQWSSVWDAWATAARLPCRLHGYREQWPAVLSSAPEIVEAEFHLHLHPLLKSSFDCASTVAAAAGGCASTVVSVCESRPTAAGLLCDSPVGVAWRSGAQWPCSSRGRWLGLNLQAVRPWKSGLCSILLGATSIIGRHYARTVASGKPAPHCGTPNPSASCIGLGHCSSYSTCHGRTCLTVLCCAVLVKSRVMWRRDSDGMEQLDA